MKIRLLTKKGFAITVTIARWTLKVGVWSYGWDNPSWYKRFDHIRAMVVVWKVGATAGSKFYSARGFDRTVIIRENGAWLHFPKLHR